MIDLFGSGDSTVVFAFWLGVAVVAVTVLMLLVILVMRQVVLRRERRHRAAVELWSRVLDRALPEPARLAAGDVTGFIFAWVGKATEDPSSLPALREAAMRLGLERHLLRNLAKGGFHEHISAITALGLLGNRAHFSRIAPFLENSSPIVSLCAARALMQLHPVSAMSMFVPQITRREDWARGRVAAILREADAVEVSRELSEATLRANADVAPRLVRFLATVSPKQASPIIRRILSERPGDHVVSTCLQVMTDPADLDLVRPLVKHERWHVRLHAAVALGRLGADEDVPLLTALLTDEQWWVRYRAAQALSQLPAVGDHGLARLAAVQADRFARDILEHVMAEKKFGIAA